MKVFGWICLGFCVIVIGAKIVMLGPAAVLGSIFSIGIVLRKTIEHYNS
jgi:hypothetical protein